MPATPPNLQAVGFPPNPAVGDAHYDALANIFWRWTGTEWAQGSPGDIYPWDQDRDYSEGDLVIWPPFTAAQGGTGFVGTWRSLTQIQAPEAWDPNNWELISRPFQQGWFDPTVAGGGVGVTVAYPIVNGTVEYSNNEYVIALEDGQYDLINGIPSPVGSPIRRGDRLVYDGTDWAIIASDQSRMKGWFDPNQSFGGPLVDYEVVDGSAIANAEEYVVCIAAGGYNFGTGQPDPTGEQLQAGQRIRYDGTNWLPEDLPSPLLRGWMDCSTDGGGAKLPFPVVDASADYLADQYVIVEVAGNYNFATGLVDITAPFVEVGSRVQYTGAVWIVIGGASQLNRGYFDPTAQDGQPPAPFPVVDQTTDYEPDQYVIAVASGLFDFATGTPDGGGARELQVSISDRVILLPNLEWLVLPVSSGLIKGQFNPNAVEGGGLVEFPVINGSTEYVNRDMVIAIADGWYDFGNGQPGASPTATWARSGNTYAYIGTAWVNINVDGTQFRGWMDASQDNGALDPFIVDGNGQYSDGDFVIVGIDGDYNFGTGLANQPPPVGIELKAGDIIRYSGTNWIRVNEPANFQHLGYYNPNTGLVNDQAGVALPAPDADNAGKWYRISVDSTVNQFDAAAAGVHPDLIPAYPVDVTDPSLGGDTGLFYLNYIISDGTNWTWSRSVGTGIRDLYDTDTVTRLPVGGDILTWDDTQRLWVPLEPAQEQHLGYFDPNTGDIDEQLNFKLPPADATNAGFWYRVSTDSTIAQAAAAAAAVPASIVLEYPLVVGNPALGGGTGLFHLNYIISDGAQWNLRRSVGTGLGDLYDVNTRTPLPQDGDILVWDGAQSRWVAGDLPPSNVVKEVVTQVAHGFAPLTNIYFDQTAGAWATAQATSIPTLKAAMVGRVLDADTFEAVYYGVVNIIGHGYTTGVPAYLDEAAGGGNVILPPAAPNTFVQITFEAIDADHVKVLDQAVIGNT